MPEERLSCWADVPEDRVEVALPEERVVAPLERVPEVVVPEERVALLPELREDWVAEPLERLVLLPVLRVVVPVPRLRLSCCTEPEERLVLLPDEEPERTVLPEDEPRTGFCEEAEGVL